MLSHFARSNSNALRRAGINRMGLTATKHQTRTLTNLNVGVLKETEAGECKFIKIINFFTYLTNYRHVLTIFHLFAVSFDFIYPTHLFLLQIISISVLNSFSLNFKTRFISS